MIETNLNLADILGKGGTSIPRGKSKFNISHPIHGSENGENMAVDAIKNCWTCFRCKTGGGPLELIGVQEGIIECDKVKKGCLRGELLRKVLLAGKVKYGLDIDIAKKLEKNLSIFQPMRWEEFEKIEYPETEWLVKGLIPGGSLVMLCAPSTSGKTWLSYYLADCLQRGKNFLDQEQFKTEQANILYVDGELSRRLMRKRGKKLKMSPDARLAQASNYSLNSDEGVESLSDYIAANNIKVVFIDTLRAVGDGINEDSGAEIRKFYNRFMPLRDEGVTFIFLDHQRKPGNGMNAGTPRKEDLIGSQDKTSGVDVLLMLTKHEKEITVYQTKCREEVEIKPFTFVMNDVQDEYRQEFVTMEYKGEVAKAPAKKDCAKEAILSILGGGDCGREEVVTRCKDVYDVGEKNVTAALKDLRKSGAICARTEGRKDVYSLGSMSSDVLPMGDR